MFVCYRRGRTINTASWCVGFNGNGEVGEGGCREQSSSWGTRRDAYLLQEQEKGSSPCSQLPLRPNPKAAGSHSCSPCGHRQLFPARLSSPGGGKSWGWGFPQAVPSGTLALHPTSCLVGWLGRLLNELFFTGFSSMWLTNHLIP